MSANFTPTLNGYTGQHPFRFWCQTALPLIYDDSLSYYELLNKMVVYLNNVISDVGNMESNVNALLSAYNQLQEYVNTYFDNLDVQEEINNKLDAMAEGGTLSTLIAPFVADGLPSVVGDQIDSVVANQIDASVGSQIDESVASQIATPVATNVTSWLNENVTPVGSAVVVDESLSISGAAADAKKTGDKINDLKSALHNTESQIIDAVNINDGNNIIKITRNQFINTNYSIGAVVNLTPGSATTEIGYAVVSCVAGNKFILTGKGGGDARLWAFLDVDNKLLNKSGSNLTVENLEITAPTNAATLVININGIAVKERTVMQIIQDLRSNIISAYSSSATYSFGDYVFYNDVFYMCIANIDTAEAWDGQKWIRIVGMDEVTKIYAFLKDNLFCKKMTANMSPGTRLSSVGSTQNNPLYSTSDFIPCKAGDVFYIEGKTDRICYYNANQTSLSGTYPIQSNAGFTKITIPNGSGGLSVNYMRFSQLTKLVVNVYNVKETEICNDALRFTADEIIFDADKIVIENEAVSTDSLDYKENYITKNAGSGLSRGINIYLKNKNNPDNFTCWFLWNGTSDAENGYDLWQIRGVYPIRNGVAGSSYTEPGAAFECAIKEYGKADFVGCYPHGNQYIDYIKIYVDGVEYTFDTLPTYASPLFFNQVDLYMGYTVYSYGTNKTTVFGHHFVHYHFAEMKCIIEQSFVFEYSCNLGYSFLAMLPSLVPYSALQNIAGKFFVPGEEQTPRIKGGLYGESFFTGGKIRMEIVNATNAEDTAIYSEVGDTKNKIYKYICNNNASVNAGDVYTCKTVYETIFN